MPTTSCIFCKIVSGEEPSVQLYADHHTIAFMDKYPANDGHCLVIPRTHYETVFEMPPEEFAAVARTVVKIAAGVQRGLQPDGLSLVQANGPIAGQSVMHVHVHVLPRRQDDNLLINWSRLEEGDPARIVELAELIRAQLLSECCGV
jgi:histidine triad (HIT) family protein